MGGGGGGCCWLLLHSRRMNEVKSILSCPSAGRLMADKADPRSAGPSAAASGKCQVWGGA